MHYISSKISATIGFLVGAPSTIAVFLQTAPPPMIQSVTLVLGIATGVFGLLWAMHKYPVEQRLKQADEVFLENSKLRTLNIKQAEIIERLTVKLAKLEESGEHPKPNLEKYA